MDAPPFVLGVSSGTGRDSDVQSTASSFGEARATASRCPSAVPTCLSKSSFVLNRTNRLFTCSTAAGQMNRFVRLLITAISRKRSLARLANLVGTALAHFPSVAGTEQLVDSARAALGHHILDLIGHDVFVARDVVPGTKHANGSGETGHLFHLGEQKRVRRIAVLFVMNEQIVLGNAIA